MTVIDVPELEQATSRTTSTSLAPSLGGDEPRGPAWTGRSVASLLVLWLVVAAVSIVAVTYGLGGYLAARDQRLLLSDYRAELSQVANESTGLGGVTEVTVAPEIGAPVGILEIPDVQLQQVAVEGVAPAETQRGPGHVPGTAALGQPGNSALVGRRGMYGGVFGQLENLREGDRIVTTTRQGASVYIVESVRNLAIVQSPDGPARSGPVAAAAEESDVDLGAGSSVDPDVLYGPTEGDQLTLVTSESTNPFNSSAATVVVAKLDGSPFEPTPQNGRTLSQTGTGSDPSAWPPLVLALLGYLVTVFGAAALYRRSRGRVVYLVTVAPFIVFTILVAQTASHLLPAWT